MISIEVSEKLEYQPGKLIVNVYKRPQYALPQSGDSEAGVIAAAMPDDPIAKCKADIGLLAHVIVSKFCDHRAPRGCAKDEGRPFEAAMQVEASNHLKLLWSKAMVVSVKEKARQDLVR